MNNLRILVIDNDYNIINSISSLIIKMGHSCSAVSNSSEGLEHIKQEHFDLLIVSFRLSPISGDNLIEKIREFNKDIYIILLTDFTHLAPSLDTLQKFNISGYCKKGNNFDQLYLLIKNVMTIISQKNSIKTLSNTLAETNERLESAYTDSIQALLYTVEAKTPYTKGHSLRVSAYSVLIGKNLNLPENDLQILKIGGLFHDIGKIGIPDSILFKNSTLTDDEYFEIKKHPLIGTKILSNSKMYQEILPIVKFHHERFDGKGYPLGLSCNDIPYLARIVTIADSYDAMTSKRSYRDALPVSVVKTEFKNNLGTQFDPVIGQLFLDILDNNYDELLEIQNNSNV